MTLQLSRRKWIIIAILAVLAVAGGIFGYVKFFREEPAPFFASEEEHFLFGSIGTEAEQGVPYWIWLVLPRVFPEYLPGPGGYYSLGMLGKDGHELPVGFSKVTVGFPRVGINCAICHAATYRARPDDIPTIVPAGPSHQAGEQQYLRFLFACATDPRFTGETILAEIDKNIRLSAIDRMLYKFVIIPQTRQGILRQQGRNAWMWSRTDWGRGRIDPFNPVKFGILKQPIDETIGNSDMQPVWNIKRHEGYAFHWDGLNQTLQEVVLSSTLGDGATTKWVDRDFAKWNSTVPREMSSMRRIQDYISTVEPPKYPLPIDTTLAATGAGVYQQQCASCHAPGGARIGTIVPAEEVGTDRHRMEMWNAASANAYNGYGQGHPWKFSHFQSTKGYVAVPLDGLWLRGPYLHNGSVPTLSDLLLDPSQRPTSFWRGNDVLDPDRVGFVTSWPGSERTGTWFDTHQPGNSNAGHLYGTALPPDQKRALIEFLKTQ